MRYELSDAEWTAIKPMLPSKPRWRATGERPPGPQWHLLGLTIWGAMARPAEQLRSLHLLQSFRSLATSWCLGEDHERTRRGS